MPRRSPESATRPRAASTGPWASVYRMGTVMAHSAAQAFGRVAFGREAVQDALAARRDLLVERPRPELGAGEPPLEHVAPAGVRLGLLEEQLRDGLVDQDAREALGVQHRQREIPLRVPLPREGVPPLGHRDVRQRLELARRRAREQVLLRGHRERLELGDAPLERVASGHRPPAGLPHPAHERLRALDDAEQRVLHRHERLDLARPLVHGQDERVAQELLRAVFARVADAAVDLHVAPRDLDRLLGREVLEERRVATREGRVPRELALAARGVRGAPGLGELADELELPGHLLVECARHAERAHAPACPSASRRGSRRASRGARWACPSSGAPRRRPWPCCTRPAPGRCSRTPRRRARCS